MRRISKKAANVRVKKIKAPASDRETLLPYERPKRTKLFTAEIRAQILRNIENGNPLVSSFILAGVSSGSIKHWVARAKEGDNDYALFFETVEVAAVQAEARHRMMIEIKARGEGIPKYGKNEKGEEVIVSHTTPDLKACIFLLQNGATRRNWVPTERKEITGKNGAPIQVQSNPWENWTDDEIEAFAKTGKIPEGKETPPKKLQPSARLAHDEIAEELEGFLFGR